jgi:acyl-CoA synthetase (AMP-forming)/AMP-acid ligase II
MRVDAILVPPDLPPDRLARLLDEQRVAATVHGADDVRAHAGPRTPIRASAAHPSAAHRSGVRPPRWGGVVVLTSGTTGAPRGVSHRLPGRTLAAAVGTHLDLVPMRRGEAIVVVPPLHHGYGLCYLAAGLGLGAVVVVPDRADPRGILDAVLDSGATVLVALPIHLRRIVDLPPEVLAGYAARLPGSLRTVVTGSAPLPSCVLDRARDLFGDRVLDLYGSTEAGWASVATPADLRAAPGTVGRPPRGVGVRIVGASGRVLPPGAVGAVQVRGWRARGAWVATGDVGHRDVEGRLFLDGRADEMIVSGGENVYPGPTLAALRAHPGVADALLCPVPDDEFGTRWRAAVRARPGTTLTEDELRGWVRPRLARAEVPRDIEIVTEMPRGATGKPVRAPG